MRPRVRSYGDTSTVTRSPARMRMRKRRILPALEVDAEHGARQDVRDGAFHLDRSFFHLNLTFGELASESRPRCQFKCSSLFRGGRGLECVVHVSAAKV